MWHVKRGIYQFTPHHQLELLLIHVLLYVILHYIMSFCIASFVYQQGIVPGKKETKTSKTLPTFFWLACHFIVTVCFQSHLSLIITDTLKVSSLLFIDKMKLNSLPPSFCTAMYSVVFFYVSPTTNQQPCVVLPCIYLLSEVKKGSYY